MRLATKRLVRGVTIAVAIVASSGSLVTGRPLFATLGEVAFQLTAGFSEVEEVRRKITGVVTAHRIGLRSKIRMRQRDNLTQEIRECLRHTEECAREAAELPDGSVFRQDFLELQNRWLELARSIEFGEQLDSFTKKPRRV